VAYPAFFCLQSHYRARRWCSAGEPCHAQGAYKKHIAKIAALKPGSSEVVPEDFYALRDKFTAGTGQRSDTSHAVTAQYDV
jgi:hypothetical protein